MNNRTPCLSVRKNSRHSPRPDPWVDAAVLVTLLVFCHTWTKVSGVKGQLKPHTRCHAQGSSWESAQCWWLPIAPNHHLSSHRLAFSWFLLLHEMDVHVGTREGQCLWPQAFISRWYWDSNPASSLPWIRTPFKASFSYSLTRLLILGRISFWYLMPNHRAAPAQPAFHLDEAAKPGGGELSSTEPRTVAVLVKRPLWFLWKQFRATVWGLCRWFTNPSISLPISSLQNPFKVYQMWQVSRSLDPGFNVLTLQKASSIPHHPQSAFQAICDEVIKMPGLFFKFDVTEIKITTIMSNEWIGSVKHVF